jgi:hypothetical protein
MLVSLLLKSARFHVMTAFACQLRLRMYCFHSVSDRSCLDLRSAATSYALSGAHFGLVKHRLVHHSGQTRLCM